MGSLCFLGKRILKKVYFDGRMNSHELQLRAAVWEFESAKANYLTVLYMAGGKKMKVWVSHYRDEPFVTYYPSFDVHSYESAKLRKQTIDKASLLDTILRNTADMTALISARICSDI